MFAGLIACKDPARAGVQDSILTARRASIKVIMITGETSLPVVVMD